MAMRKKRKHLKSAKSSINPAEARQSSGLLRYPGLHVSPDLAMMALHNNVGLMQLARLG